MADRAQQAAIRRATLAAQQQVVDLDAASIEELQQLYQQTADDIARQIVRYAGTDGNVSLYQLQDLLAQVNARLAALAQARNTLLDQSLNEAAGLGTQPFETTTLAPTIPLQANNTGTLSPSAAIQIKNDTLQFVRTFIAADGLQLSDRLWRLDRHARDAVVNSIEQAIIRGHGAAQAARELLMKGQPISGIAADKINAANAQEIGKTAGELLTGDGSPMDNAMRVMRTEINRAHGESYIQGALAHPDTAGIRFKLSPAHPKPDICDLLSRQNLYGLGEGVYPDRESCPWPAHPNTLSFLETVFNDQVTTEDQGGKETSIEALGRLTPEQRKGVLGTHKAEVFDQGEMTSGMIRSSWSAVKKRIGA
jgi:hypothetical protein